jgi:hypothetical protein
MASSGRMSVGDGQNGFIGRCRREICDQLVLIWTMIPIWWFGSKGLGRGENEIKEESIGVETKSMGARMDQTP